MKLYFYCFLPKELILIAKRNTNIKNYDAFAGYYLIQ